MKLNSLNQVSATLQQNSYNHELEPSVINTKSINAETESRQNPQEYSPNIQEKNIIDTIEKVNKKLSGDDKQLQFSVHKQTKQIIVKIINTDTKETIREIPSEKILDMIASMCEMAGLFVDEKR